MLVGDRAFQMTGPEISHAREHWCNPIIVLFNNSRWEMLQAFFHEARYHSTVPWPFAALAERWGGRGLEVRTPRQLREALAAAWRTDCFTFIDVELERGDDSARLRPAFKKQASVS